MNGRESTSIGLEPNIAAGLAYLGQLLTGIIFMVVEKKNGYVRFHAAQSVVIFGGLWVLGFAVSLFTVIPFLGLLLVPVGGILGLAGFVLWILCMVYAFQGKDLRLPLAADLADRLIGAEAKHEGVGTGTRTPPGGDSKGPTQPEEKPGPTGAPRGGEGAGRNALLMVAVVVGGVVLLCGGIVAAGVFFLLMRAPEEVRAGVEAIKDTGELPIAGENGARGNSTGEEGGLFKDMGVIRADNESLRKFFPEKLGEWTRKGGVSITRFGEGDNQYVHLQTRYTREGRSVEIWAGGGPGYDGLVATQRVFQVDSDRILRRRTVVGGYPGYEQVERQRKEASLMVRVGKLAVVLRQKGVADTEDLRAVFGELDSAGLAEIR